MLIISVTVSAITVTSYQKYTYNETLISFQTPTIPDSPYTKRKTVIPREIRMWKPGDVLFNLFCFFSPIHILLILSSDPEENFGRLIFHLTLAIVIGLMMKFIGENFKQNEKCIREQCRSIVELEQKTRDIPDTLSTACTPIKTPRASIGGTVSFSTPLQSPPMRTSAYPDLIPHPPQIGVFSSPPPSFPYHENGKAKQTPGPIYSADSGSKKKKNPFQRI